MRVISIDPFVRLDEVGRRAARPHHLDCIGDETDPTAVEVVLTAGVGLPRQMLRSMPNLIEVITAGTGIDHLELDALQEAGVAVTNVPGYCTEEVSDHAVALTCALFRSLPSFLVDARAAWESPEGIGVKRFSSVHAGVLGTGRIGRAICRKLAALGMRVSVATRPDSRHAVGAVPGAELGVLDEILPKLDVLIVASPGSVGEAPVLGRAALDRMLPGTFLVNVSRASLVDLQAMQELLQEGRLAGAYFDVWDPEPPTDFGRLAEVPGLFISPHSGWYSPDSADELWERIAERLDELSNLKKRPSQPSLMPSDE